MPRALLFTVLCTWADPTSTLPLTLIASLARRSAPWVGISTLHHMVGSVCPIVLYHHSTNTSSESSTAMVADKSLFITEAAAFSKTIKLYNEFGGVVLTDEESQRIVNAMGEHGKAMILRNHGIISVGRTLESAIAFYVRLEQLCESQLMADAAGVPVAFEEVDETDIFALYGGEEEAYFEAQKLFQAIERETGGAHKL